MAKAASGRYGFWTLRRVLFILALLFSIGVLVNQVWTARSFKALALSTMNKANVDTLTLLVNDRIGRLYLEKISPHVAEWSRHPNITAAVKEGDPKKMEIEATALHNEAVFTQGQFTLVNANIYSPDFKLLASSTKGNGESLLSHEEVKKQLASRDTKEQRQPAGFYWRTSKGEPVHSIISPIGGFRVVGFLEIVTDPTGMLKGLGETMGGDFTLSDVNGNLLMDEKVIGQNADGEGNTADGGDAAKDGGQAAGNTAATTGADNKDNKDAATEQDGKPAADDTAAAAEPAKHPGGDFDTVRISLPDSLGETWANATLTRDVSEFNANVDEMRNLSMALVIGGVLIAWIGGWSILQGVVFRPMRRFARAMEQIGEGNTEVEIPRTGKDEMGVMAQALAKLREGSKELERIREEQDRQNRERQEEMQAKLQDMSSRLDEELRSTVGAVRENMTKLVDIADEMTRSATDARTRSERVSAAAEDATAKTETVSEISGQVVDSFEEVHSLASRSSEVADRAREDADQASRLIEALAEDTRKIGDIIELITEIADQTNMLALNATIEAARAGEMGKGFAVVAGEVKSLANRTVKATDDISRQIGQVQERTKSTVEAITKIAETIHNMNSMSRSIADTVSQRTEGARQITIDVREASAKTREVTDQIDGVTNQSGHVGELSEQVKNSASEVAKGIETLRERLARIIH